MASDRVSNHFQVLEDTLWKERNLLEYLLFKLVVANLVLAADAAEFIGLAVQEVDQVMHRIKAAEEYRDTVVKRVAGEVGVPTAELSLEYLAAAAPDEVRYLFEDHRSRFLELVAEIERVTIENRRLATVNLDAIRGTLGLAGGVATGNLYDAGGRPEAASSDPAMLDRVL